MIKDKLCVLNPKLHVQWRLLKDYLTNSEDPDEGYGTNFVNLRFPLALTICECVNLI